MKATDQLKEEHKGVLLMLQILEAVCQRLKKGQEVNPEHLSQILEFLKVFVDRCHHTKEEELLFPAMEKAGVPNEGGPIGMMLLEHDQGRGYIKGFAEAVESYQSGDKKTGAKIIKNAQGYINLLKEHINKEDGMLYVIADMHLSKKEQEKLAQEFEKVEKERIGLGKHEQFHKLLDELEKVYLKS